MALTTIEELVSGLTLKTGASIPSAPSPPSDEAKQFTQRVKGLMPQLKEAVQKGGEAGQEIKLRASEARMFARKKDYDQANTILDQAEQLLQQVLGAADTGPNEAELSKQRAVELAKRLKGLKPSVDKLVNIDPSHQGELYASMAQIAGEIKDKQFDIATESIEGFDKQLQGLLAQAAMPGDAASPARKWEQRRDALEPRLLEAQAANRDKATKIGTVWNYASEQAAAGNYANSFKALDRLEQAINGILGIPSDKAPEVATEDTAQSLLAFMKRWESLSSDLQTAIKANPDKRASLDFSYQQSHDLAQEDDFAKAHAILDRLETQITEALQSAPQTDAERLGIRDGIVAEQKQKLEEFFRQRVVTAKAETKIEVAKVEMAIQEVPDEDPKELSDAINQALSELYDEVAAALNAALATESNTQVLKTIGEWRGNVEKNDLVLHVQQAKKSLGADANVLHNFVQLFSDAEAQVKATAAASQV